MKKIAIIGANGQLGQYLLSSLSALECESVQCKLIGLNREILDLNKTEKIQTILSEIRPDILINASAYTAVDKAESEPELAHRINCLAPAEIAAFAFLAKIPFIHYSTDYVFAGDANTPYLESDQTAPQGEYGASKLAGEKKVLDSCAQAYIFRTAWVYSQKGSNFYKTMLNLAQNRTELNVVQDQIGSPTYAASIAKATSQIVSKLISGEQFSSGVYHMTCQGQTNWAEFAKTIFELNNVAMTVCGIPSSEYPTPAKRPNYSVLNNQKLLDVFGVNLPSWQDSLNDCVKEKKG